MDNAFSPFEGCRLSVVGGQEAVDSFPYLSWRGKTGPARGLPVPDAEPDTLASSHRNRVAELPR